MSLLDSSPSFDDEEPKDDGHNIHTMRWELAVARQALRDGCREVERLNVCLSMTKTMFGAVNGEAAKAKATDVAAHAKLAGELNFIFITFFAKLFLP